MNERSYPWGEPRDDEYEEEPTCKHCGYQMDWAECHMIDCEDGQYDAYEQDAINNDLGTYVKCYECNGQGGHWYCPNKDCNPPSDAPPLISPCSTRG